MPASAPAQRSPTLAREAHAQALHRARETELVIRVPTTPSTCHALAHDGVQEFIAVVDAAVAIDHLQAIGVAVQRDADLGATGLHLARQQLGMRARLVDVEAVRMHADGVPRRQLAEHVRRDVVAAPWAASTGHAVQVQVVGEGALAEFDVAALRVGRGGRPNPSDPTQPGGSSSAASISASMSSGSFMPCAEKNLMPLSW